MFAQFNSHNGDHTWENDSAPDDMVYFHTAPSITIPLVNSWYSRLTTLKHERNESDPRAHHVDPRTSYNISPFRARYA